MPSSDTIPVAILAGGLASRLRPMTETIPKSLIEVAGEPFINHQLRLLRREGIEQVVLCVGYLGDMVHEVVGSGRQFGLNVHYSFDGSKLLGTGGALRHALPLLDKSFFVLYGDSYLDVSFAPVLAAFRRRGAPALMTVFENEGRWDTSNVVFDGEWVSCHSKRARTPNMHYIDYGLGIITRDVLTLRPAETTFDLSDVYSELAAAHRLAGYEITTRFYEIGSREGIADAEAYLRRKS